MTVEPLIQVNRVSHSFGTLRAVSDVTLSVNSGEIHCLLGPSGSGKSTLLRIIAGLQQQDAGEICIGGETVSDARVHHTAESRAVGFVFQDFALFPHLTVSENIAYGLSSLDRHETLCRMDELLERTQLRQHADKYPHMLSGGEQQRVALARALAPQPNLLLLDEPFSGLDTMLREQMGEETLSTLKELGITSVMVTHDPEEALTTADRIVLMDEGNVVQIGTPTELFRSPSSVFSARFFGRINQIDGVVDGNVVKTDLGAFRNPELSQGATVHVLLRPEALKVLPLGSGSPLANQLLVCGVQYAGNSSLIRLGIGDWPHTHTHIVVRHTETGSFDLGEKIPIEIDQDQVFVFEK